MNNFQTILVAIFLAFFVFAVLIFSGAINLNNKSSTTTLKGKVTIWGDLPFSSFSPVLDSITSNNQDLSINYSYKNPSTYQQDIIEAIANDNGPDLFILKSNMVQKNLDFLYKIPYTSYSQKTFNDSFIDGASIDLDKDGIIGFPLVVDPMVMYYNKDILSNEGVVNPPKTWDELLNLNGLITKKENDGAINQSMIALGQYYNINNAKDILATLLIQNNNPIITLNNDGYFCVLKDGAYKSSSSPAETVIKFFIDFSNPSSQFYSWNKSLPNSFDMFTSGKLAFYLGRASELFNIENTNPNLSFNVTDIPQIKDTTMKRTYADIYTIAVNKKSPNISAAFQVASILSSGDIAKDLSIALSLPPASRSLLAEKPTDSYLSTFFNSALISRSWADPNTFETDLIFNELIENVLSNKLSVNESISKAQGQIEILNKKKLK